MGERRRRGEREEEPVAPPRRAGVGSRVIGRLRRTLEPRALRIAASIVAGLLVCAGFPPFNWGWVVFVAFGLLAWVLNCESTTKVGGFGYGVLFGVAFYVPLLPWISGLVGPMPWLAL